MTLMGIARTIGRDWPPFLLSAFAIGLGIGPGWIALRHFRLAEYDPTIAVLTATLVALIWTADYTFHAVNDGRRREEREEQRRASARKSILDGVVAELNSSDMWLEQVDKYLYHVRVRKLERPMMAEALRNADLFEDRIIPIISQMSAHFQVIEGAVAKLADTVSRLRPDYQNMGPETAGVLARESVNKLRSDVYSLRENIREAGKLLSPEIYGQSSWPELGSGPFVLSEAVSIPRI
jgi:hypothetical protein